MSTSVAPRILYPLATPLSANQMAHQQFDRIADRLGLDRATRERLRSPRRGVTASCFEQVPSNPGHYWSGEDVIAARRASTSKAFRQIVEMSERECVTLRDAAYIIAVQRVAEARRLKGRM